MRMLFTSESVTEGHPDKICDQISDAVLDAILAQDPNAHVACECCTTKIPAKGGFTNVDKTVIYFVVNRFQIARMKNIVHTIDPAAYLTISEVADVFKSVAPKLLEKEKVEEVIVPTEPEEPAADSDA